MNVPVMIFDTRCIRWHKDVAGAAACEGDDNDDDDGSDTVIIAELSAVNCLKMRLQL